MTKKKIDEFLDEIAFAVFNAFLWGCVDAYIVPMKPAMFFSAVGVTAFVGGFLLADARNRRSK